MVKHGVSACLNTKPNMRRRTWPRGRQAWMGWLWVVSEMRWVGCELGNWKYLITCLPHPQTSSFSLIGWVYLENAPLLERCTWDWKRELPSHDLDRKGKFWHSKNLRIPGALLCQLTKTNFGKFLLLYELPNFSLYPIVWSFWVFRVIINFGDKKLLKNLGKWV